MSGEPSAEYKRHVDKVLEYAIERKEFKLSDLRRDRPDLFYMSVSRTLLRLTKQGYLIRNGVGGSKDPFVYRAVVA